MADISLDKKIEKVNNSASLKMALAEKIRELTNTRAELKSSQDKVKQLELEIEEVKKSADKQVANAEKTFKLVKTNDEVKKTVLRLRARNMSNLKIYNWCNDNGISINEDEVKYIIDNISMLEPTLETYYKEQCKAYSEGLQINSESLKQSIIDITLESVNILDDMIKKEMEKSEGYDAQLVKNLLNERNSHIKTLNGLLGNIVEEGKEEKGVNIEIQNLQNELKDRSDKIIKFGIGNIKVI